MASGATLYTLVYPGRTAALEEQRQYDLIVLEAAAAKNAPVRAVLRSIADLADVDTALQVLDLSEDRIARAEAAVNASSTADELLDGWRIYSWGNDLAFRDFPGLTATLSGISGCESVKEVHDGLSDCLAVSDFPECVVLPGRPNG